MNTIERLLNVPSTDPDDARHRKLLNIMLIIIGLVTLISIIYINTVPSTGEVEQQDYTYVYLASLGVFIGVLVIFAINRFWSGKAASVLFLLILIVAVAFGDEPKEVVEGRTLIMFAVPIMMASVLLRPYASFATAGLSSVTILIVTQFMPEDTQPNVPGILTLLVLAAVSWLFSRSLENALKEVRTVNAELDQRVERRTQELSQANHQLAEANERLQELDRLKSKFVSMVSHELRTPLNAIQGFAEMIAAGIYGTISPQQEGALERITANTNRLLKIVNDLLDQARIEAGELSVRNAPFYIQDLVDGLEATMDILVGAKGLELKTEITDDIPQPLLGDQHRLQQILVNLTNNALKFTENGYIMVQVYQPDKDHWGINISDTGRGIPKDAQAYIFEPFRQVNGSETSTQKGVGLGLSIVKQLIQLMQGTITLESEIGKGSTFKIVLPILTPNEEEK